MEFEIEDSPSTRRLAVDLILWTFQGLTSGSNATRWWARDLSPDGDRCPSSNLSGV